MYKQLKPAEAVQTVVPAKPHFTNMATALAAISDAIGEGESLKLKIARYVQSIRDQRLYTELGFDSFEKYLPALLEVTAGIGWTAERTVQQYLAFADVFLDELGFDEKLALEAVSHLNLVLKLADRDRKTGLLCEHTEKEGKLGDFDFSAVASVIATAANWTGDPGDAFAQTMTANDEGGEYARVNELLGYKLLVPVGGWSLADTRSVVDTLSGKVEKPKIEKIITGEQTADGTFRLVRLEVFVNGEELLELDLGDRYIDERQWEALTHGFTVAK